MASKSISICFLHFGHSNFSCVRFLQRYVQKETESMQSSKSNVTATTLATRQKKMAEMCSLIKYFIRYANKRKDAVIFHLSSD